MDKPDSLRGQKKSSPWPKNCLGVITVVFWRQHITVLASTSVSIDANTHDWPREEKILATGRKFLATGGFEVGHRTDRSLIGVGKDLARIRKGFAPATERFGSGQLEWLLLSPLGDLESWSAGDFSVVDLVSAAKNAKSAEEWSKRNGRSWVYIGMSPTPLHPVFAQDIGGGGKCLRIDINCRSRTGKSIVTTFQTSS